MSAALLISANALPLAVRMRPDLEFKAHTYQGRQSWIVKDPLALKYFRFEEPELSILQSLDGRASTDQVCQQFQQRFAPQRITGRELHQLLGHFHRSGLVLSEAPGQGERLETRACERRRQAWLGKLANVLAIRFSGVDPDRWLAWLARRAGWMFSLPAAAAAILLMLAALLLLAAEFDIFCSRLPVLEEFFAAQNWLALAATLAVTKILHEFGHGLACKRFGGECHEMGLMLLVFTPCLYCNVTDSWMLSSKWKRAAIGAAGMYVELILASLATFGWWYSRPGVFNGLCLNVIFVCSVSTLLFNANPLLRFDGYYILSDLLEIPNLRQKASLLLQRKLAAWYLGLPQPPDPFLPARRQWMFALYGVAAAAYGWFITLSIFWFLYQVLAPYGMKVVGQLLSGAMVLLLVVLPLVRLAKLLQVPGRIDRVNKVRAIAMFSLTAAAIAAALLVPLPHYVPCSFYVQPRGATTVYVEVPGEIRRIFAGDDAVEAGEPLLELDSVEAVIAEQSLVGQRNQLLAGLDSLRQLAHSDPNAHLELAAARQMLVAVEEQLAQRRRQNAKLVIRAPGSGLLLPPVRRPGPEANEGAATLPTWSGRPLSPRNVGAYLEAGTIVGRVAQAGQFEAILVIDQDQIEFVKPGQRVDLFPRGLPGQRRVSQVEQLSQQELQSAPASLSLQAGGPLATRVDKQGVERPVEVAYQASALLPEETQLLAGATGQAKIHAGWQPLAPRLWRSFCRTFRFEM